ncbi:MAG: hypothetical protein HY043_02445 [Verrucomicrobia bacterium]|nr:hypothetical protein [Verrucomicrobiota bacterium]
MKSPLQLQRADHAFGLASAGSLSRGYTARYLFNTQNATRQTGEPNHCGVIGGASQWYALTNEVPGIFTLRTVGSEFSTLIAVYTLPRNRPLNMTNLVLATCDNHGTNSVVHFNAQPGTTYYVVVDGANGGKGNVQLNVSFDVPSQVTAPHRLLNGNFGFKLISRPGAVHRVEASSDLTNWIPILKTNSPSGELDFEDPISGHLPLRWYRVVQEQ